MESIDSKSSDQNQNTDLSNEVSFFYLNSLVFKLKINVSDSVFDLRNLLKEKIETCHLTCYSLCQNNKVVENYLELATDTNEQLELHIIEDCYTQFESIRHIKHIIGLINTFSILEEKSKLSNFCLRSIQENETNVFDCTPPSYIFDSFNNYEFLIEPLLPVKLNYKALNMLSTSVFNPPSRYRKTHGDLIYLYFKSLENKIFYITSSTKGFFVNKSTEEKFDGNPVNKKNIYHSLVDLLNSLSFKFKNMFSLILKMRFNLNPLELLKVPIQSNTWFSNINERNTYFPIVDFYWQNRNWNEEIQDTKELCNLTPTDRIIKERTYLNIYSKFIIACTIGAKQLIDEKMTPYYSDINTGRKMFCFNNLFFTLSSTEIKAQNNELKCVYAFNNIDVEGLHTVATMLVDYKGHRILAQSIIPGVLNKDASKTIAYGLANSEKQELRTNNKFEELLKKAGTKLNFKSHYILNNNAEKVEIFAPVECKGIVGDDERHYVLDLFKTFPIDVTFCEPNVLKNPYFDDNINLTRDYKTNYFCLRENLMFYYADYNKKKFILQTDEQQTKDKQPDLQFHPNIFSKDIKFDPKDMDKLDVEKQYIIGASEFIHTVQIPGFIKDCLQFNTTPFDGSTLCQSLHSRGINLRYLGKIVENLSVHESLKYLFGISLCELLIRSAKRIFRLYIMDIENTQQNIQSISNFLNCLFLSNYKAKNENIKSIKKQMNKTSKRMENVLTSKTLWKYLIHDLQSYYGYQLRFKSIGEIVNKFEIHQISLIRSFCLKTGITVLLRQYCFNESNCETFNENDVGEIFSIAKYVLPQSHDAKHLYAYAELLFNNNDLDNAYVKLIELINILYNGQGAMQRTVSLTFRLLAKVSYRKGDVTKSIFFQKNALIVSEKVNGVDHPSTIIELNFLAVYCFVNNQVSYALKYLYRTSYLLFLINGNSHPEMAKIKTSIGLILNSEGQYKCSNLLFSAALDIYEKCLGKNHFKCAQINHFMADNYSRLGLFKEAIYKEHKSYSIYATNEDIENKNKCLEFLKVLFTCLAEIKKLKNLKENGTLCNKFSEIERISFIKMLNSFHQL